MSKSKKLRELLDRQGLITLVGEAVGFFKLNNRACVELKLLLNEYINLGKNEIGYEDLFPLLFERVNFSAVAIDEFKWTEIDFEDDVYKAEAMDI